MLIMRSLLQHTSHIWSVWSIDLIPACLYIYIIQTIFSDYLCIYRCMHTTRAHHHEAKCSMVLWRQNRDPGRFLAHGNVLFGKARLVCNCSTLHVAMPLHALTKIQEWPRSWPPGRSFAGMDRPVVPKVGIYRSGAGHVQKS